MTESRYSDHRYSVALKGNTDLDEADDGESLVLSGCGSFFETATALHHQPCKGFDVSHRVVDRVVIVGRHAQPLPALAVVEIADEASIEVADSPAGMAERITAV
jgi:hypothetical protein